MTSGKIEVEKDLILLERGEGNLTHVISACDCCCGQCGMSRARISRANTFAPMTFDVPSMRYFRTLSFHAGRVSSCSSNNDAKALLPRGARYTAMPPIRLAPITCRRDGRKRFMRMAPVRSRNPRYAMGSIRGGVRQRQQSILIAWEVGC
jgi:hypothetical protein